MKDAIDAEEYLKFLQNRIKLVTSAMAVPREMLVFQGNHQILHVKNIGGESKKDILEKKMKKRMEESDW